MQADPGRAGIIAALLMDENAGIEGIAVKARDSRLWPCLPCCCFRPLHPLRKMLDSLPKYRTTQIVQPIHITAATGYISCVNLLLDHNKKSRRLFDGESKNKLCSTQF